MNDEPLININTTVQASPEIVTNTLGEEVVMMSIEKSAYYGLDEIGSRIWELIASERTVSSICDILVREYDVPREECEQDILAWLNELAEQNLVEITDVSSG